MVQQEQILSRVENCYREILSRNHKRVKLAKKHLAIPPNETFQIRLGFRNAKEAVAALLLVSLMIEDGFSAFCFLDLITAIGQTAYQHKYSGTWEDVQEILETPQRTLRYTLARLFFLSYHERDILGNILPLAYRLSHRVQIRKAYDPKADLRPVRRKVFRRGYDDKGSLRAAHKWLPREYDIPEQIRQRDRRSSVVIQSEKVPFVSTRRNPPLGLIPNSAAEEVDINEDVFLTQV